MYISIEILIHLHHEARMCQSWTYCVKVVCAETGLLQSSWFRYFTWVIWVIQPSQQQLGRQKCHQPTTGFKYRAATWSIARAGPLHLKIPSINSSRNCHVWKPKPDICKPTSSNAKLCANSTIETCRFTFNGEPATPFPHMTRHQMQPHATTAGHVSSWLISPSPLSSKLKSAALSVTSTSNVWK